VNRPEMIPCDQVIRRLWDYVDGELDPESAAALRAHLDMCSRCLPQYDFQKAYRAFALRTSSQVVPPHLRRRVFEAILAEEAAAEGVAASAGGAVSRLRSLLGRLLRGSEG
jgi:anti-sigma factor (TIGR02949 family)